MLSRARLSTEKNGVVPNYHRKKNNSFLDTSLEFKNICLSLKNNRYFFTIRTEKVFNLKNSSQRILFA